MSDHTDGLDLTEVKRDLDLYADSYRDTVHDSGDCGVRGRLVMAVPLLVARLDRVTRERDSLRMQMAMIENPTFIDQLAQAIADPGSTIIRKKRDSDRPESIPRWSARAVLNLIQARRKANDV